MREENSIQKELLLVKVTRHADIDNTLTKFDAKISDQSADTVTIEAVGNKAELESLLHALSKFGIKELVQSGLIALERGSATLADRTLSTSGVALSDPESATADYQN
jgi:acetolactate synthase-1/3 small subunit